MKDKVKTQRDIYDASYRDATYTDASYTDALYTSWLYRTWMTSEDDRHDNNDHILHDYDDCIVHIMMIALYTDDNDLHHDCHGW